MHQVVLSRGKDYEYNIKIITPQGGIIHVVERIYELGYARQFAETVAKHVGVPFYYEKRMYSEIIDKVMVP